MPYDFGGLIFGGAYTWRGLFSELCGTYGKISNSLNTMTPNVKSLVRFKKSTLIVFTEIWEKESNRMVKLMVGNEWKMVQQ